jgi:lysophospholipase L1-like esterase
MLRLTKAIVTAATAVALTASAAVPAMAAQRTVDHPRGEFYLSLGDSLSVGDQPRANGATLPTDAGYADQLNAVLNKSDHDLQLVKLGCPGETTLTLIKGGICGYKGAHRFSLTGRTGSQLTAAEAFLHFHPNGVPLITINIGANDVNACVTPGATIAQIITCLKPVFPAIANNLAGTLAALRKAAPNATIVGMNYYVPELAAWLQGTAAGKQFAQASIVLAGVFNNNTLAPVYKHFGVPVADVSTAFSTNDMKDMVKLPPFPGKVPLDVARICQWTWECAPPPVGPNIHANRAGYHVIAMAFWAKISHIKNAF